jgi:hypothetical protein
MRKLAFLFLCTACSMSGKPVTMEAFYEVEISTTKEELVQRLGEPYYITNKGDGTTEYEYIERVTIGARNVEERHYVIILRQGKVVSKRIKQSIPLPYTFDSYDMQTTDSSQTE